MLFLRLIIAGIFLCGAQAAPFWHSCAEAFRFGKSASHSANPAALKELEVWLQDPLMRAQMKADGEEFRLKIKGGKGSLKIGIARRQQRKLNALILRALREGSLREVDLGQVTGPKSLILIDRLREIGEKEGLRFELYGSFDIAFLRDRAESHQALNLPLPSALHYSEAERKALAEAYAHLHLDDCEARGAGRFFLSVAPGAPATFTCR